MTTMLPFLTGYDPPGSSEGALDPLGLYQIADQLATQLVPAVRERMQRIRFLTAMAVGAITMEELEEDPQHRDASPYLVWEWLIVEALVREMGEDSSIWGVPGSSVGKSALARHGYLDARSYLKTPRVFGFHGVYKRLAIHLGILDVHLKPGPGAHSLGDAWARGLGLAGLSEAEPMMSRWSAAIRRSLNEKPPRTKSGWNSEAWAELAHAFAPSASKSREKKHLQDLLHATDSRKLGALPLIWELQDKFDNNSFREEPLHDQLEKLEPVYSPIIEAIRAYEAFARSLQDAFDILKAEAAQLDSQGFVLSAIEKDSDFKKSVRSLDKQFERAHFALGETIIKGLMLQNLFSQRFGGFAEPMDATTCAHALCTHHETIQRGKSAEGKRPWFDRIGNDRIYIRHAYREARREIQPDRYVHDYRGRPIRRFHFDLA
jgi:hypothetical protein